MNIKSTSRRLAKELRKRWGEQSKGVKQAFLDESKTANKEFNQKKNEVKQKKTETLLFLQNDLDRCTDSRVFDEPHPQEVNSILPLRESKHNSPENQIRIVH